MKDYLMRVKQEEGVEAYLNRIRNTIACCREKWKKLPKVQWRSEHFISKVSVKCLGNERWVYQES